MMGLKPHPQVCTHVKKSMEANAGVLWGKKIINLRSVTPVEQITTVELTPHLRLGEESLFLLLEPHLK